MAVPDAVLKLCATFAAHKEHYEGALMNADFRMPNEECLRCCINRRSSWTS